VGPGRISVVSDAGPLIHLAEIDCLPLLSIFENVHIPHAVRQELEKHEQPFQRDVSGLDNIRQHILPHVKVTSFIKSNNLEELHIGEQECLTLCQQIGIIVLLTDDLAVRETAKRLHLTPVGSLGVVVRAYHMSRISLSEAEQHMYALYDVSSLFVTRAIVELAVEQLHKSPFSK
jgi:predicted nucleic acid-binding protein